MFELLTVLAIGAILVAVAVPGVVSVRRAFAGHAAAVRLALVLRSAQARAQSGAAVVCVSVRPDGRYDVREVATDGSTRVTSGDLGADVSTNYPGGSVEFGLRGWPSLPGASSPRAGTFRIAGGRHAVVLQLAGCIRCT